MTPENAEFFALQSVLSGRFSIERELGRGGMGIVYLARDVQLERAVAIKLLAPALGATPDMRRRFLREARLAARCFHPHIVPIHSVEEANGLAWIVMAYVRGETVAERVRRTGPLNAAQCTQLAKDIGWALAYAHERGLVHRDVKPENILIDATSERFLIADFGIAQTVGDDSGAVSGALAAAGTPRYMAPEQAAGETVDGRADLYALGGSLFYAATGRAPFDAPNASSLMVQHATIASQSVRTVAPMLSLALADSIDRCLAKLPSDRFASVAAFVESLATNDAHVTVPPSLIPVQANARGAKSLVGWGASIGLATIFLSLGEPQHSFGRDLIFGIGSALSAFMGVLGVLRNGEAMLAARRALRMGIAREDVAHALSGDIQSIPTEEISRRTSALMLTSGILLALLQGHLGQTDKIPRVLHELLQVGLLFAPAYLIGRGTVGVTRGTKVRSWLHKHVEQPLARFMTRGAAIALPDSKKLPAQLAGGTTEFRLGRAVHDAYKRLPAGAQQLLGDVDHVALALVRDAELLRASDIALQARERAARQLASETERASVLETLGAERAAVAIRLGDAVSALETLRLDLLRAEANTPSGTGLTTHLEAARHLSRQVDAAAELRAYLAHSNPTPA